MHITWSRDERPVWRFRCVFRVLRQGDDPSARLQSRWLERGIAATGNARAATVHLSADDLQVVMLIRAVDELDAEFRGLCVLDAAAAQVRGVALGELLWRAASPWRHPPASG